MYIARSKTEEDGIVIQEQLYKDHINGVYNSCNGKIELLKPYIKSELYYTIKEIVLLSATYHDLGKLDEQAQQVLKGEINSRMINHVDAGVALLLKKYNKSKDKKYLISAFIVLAHHIGFPNINKVIDENIVRNMLSVKVEHSPKNDFRDQKSVKKYNMGKSKVKNHINKNLKRYIKIHNEECKEIVKNNKKIKLSKKFGEKPCNIIIKDYMMLKLMLSILVDSDHENSAKHCNEIYVNKTYKLDADYHKKILDEKINVLVEKYKNGEISCSKDRFDLRQEFYSLCDTVNLDKSYYLVDGTVGLGKTISTMNLALRLCKKYDINNIIYVLPYIALIDQSAQQYSDFLCNGEEDAFYKIGTIHSVFKSSNKFHRKYVKGFNAPINLCTSVNFFNIITSNHTSVFSKMYKVAGSVIVIDEYDSIASHEYWPTILKILISLEENFGCKFIFSSGTPTRYWEIESITNKNIDVCEVISGDFYAKLLEMEKGRVKILNKINEEWDFNKLANEILIKNESTFVILNTRKKSVTLFNKLKGMTDRKIYLRYSGLTPKDRIYQFSNVKKDLKNNEKIILIATQGSDIGLDISFRHGFKECSDHNSINQMKGRINRNCEYNDSSMCVFLLSKTPNENDEIFYDNPSIKYKKEIIEGDFNLIDNLSPENSTRVASLEIENMSKNSKENMEYYAKIFNDRKFDDVGDNFSIINQPMVHILIDKGIYEKIKKSEYVPNHILQNNIVNFIYNEKSLEKIKDNLVKIDDEIEETEEDDDINKIKNNTYGLYYWRGDYDPNNLGIFKDPVFGITKYETLIV